MRKITRKAIDAFMKGINFETGNTAVYTDSCETRLWLFGNCIAKKNSSGISVRSAGWQTNTTKERLNGIPGISIKQIKRKWYINGKLWDGGWYTLCAVPAGTQLKLEL